jgi:RNA polymerase sigma-70 factor (ECF subfamily)
MPGTEDTEGQAGAAGDFTATHWSIVRAAQQTDSEAARAALESLCRRYWYPLYCFLRRSGHDHHAAEDLVQGFIATLLEDDRRRLRQALQPKGKFRTFLLSGLRHFLTDQWRRETAGKRGGGATHISLDELAAAQTRFANEPASSPDPGAEFDRRWACQVFDQALLALRQEYETKGKGEVFLALEALLTGAVPAGYYEEVAPRLAMTPGAVKTELSRLRHRLGELVRREIAQTLADRQDLEDELKYLCGVWASHSNGPGR